MSTSLQSRCSTDGGAEQKPTWQIFKSRVQFAGRTRAKNRSVPSNTAQNHPFGGERRRPTHTSWESTKGVPGSLSPNGSRRVKRRRLHECNQRGTTLKRTSFSFFLVLDLTDPARFFALRGLPICPTTSREAHPWAQKVTFQTTKRKETNRDPS